MTPSQEDTLWAVEQLMVFQHLWGFPKSENALMAVARAFLRIVCDQRRLEWEIDHQKKGVREAIERQVTVDHLISELLSSCEKFPSPIVMREVYERLGYECADGMSHSAMRPERE